MTEEEINFVMKKFINYEILVDGGNGNLKSAQ